MKQFHVQTACLYWCYARVNKISFFFFFPLSPKDLFAQHPKHRKFKCWFFFFFEREKWILRLQRKNFYILKYCSQVSLGICDMVVFVLCSVATTMCSYANFFRMQIEMQSFSECKHVPAFSKGKYLDLFSQQEVFCFEPVSGKDQFFAWAHRIVDQKSFI